MASATKSKQNVKLDVETKLAIISANEAGLSNKQIADKYSIPHVAYVKRVLDKKSEFLKSPGK